MYGITYNNKHSFNDLGLTVLNTRVIETPSKIKITETIPFMNGSYDFSNLYGSASYSDRELNYSFLIDVESEDDEISFKIGEENANDTFKDCAIAKADYKVNGESIASIGIIGPKRMDYAKISSALKFIVDETKKLNLLGKNDQELQD